jgi:hypothetical protein
VVSFTNFSPPKFCVQLCCLPCVLHASTTSFVLMWTAEQYRVSSTYHNVPQYVVFSTPLLPRPSWANYRTQHPIHLNSRTMFLSVPLCYTPTQIPSKITVLCIFLDSKLENKGLVFIPRTIRRIRRDQHYALIVPLCYSTYWLLHVSAVTCLCAGFLWYRGITTLRHTGHVTTRYMIYHPSDLCFKKLRKI